MTGDEDAEWSDVGEETHLIDGIDDPVDLEKHNDSLAEYTRVMVQPLRNSYRLSLERPPDDGTIMYRELGHTAAGDDSALGDVVGVHDADDIVLPVAGALDVVEELVGQIFFDPRTEEGWMERYYALEFIEEKHCELDD